MLPLMRPDPRLLAAAAAAVLLSACQRDTSLPPRNGGPRIASFTPASAYAGEPVVIAGAGFDADPQGDLVQFAGAAARAESASDRQIVVRVPPGAASGPFTVTTKGGVSAPSTAFSYLGRGELTAYSVAGALDMLHKPYRILPARDETFLMSDLLVGLVRYGDPTFVDAHEVWVDQAGWTTPDPSVVWLDSDGVSTLVRQAVAVDGAVSTQATAAISYAGAGRVVAMRAAGGRPDAVAVLRSGAGGAYSVELRRLDDLSALSAELPLDGVAEVRGCADAGDDLACLGRAVAGDPLGLFRVRFAPAAAPTSAQVAFAAPPPGTVVENPFLPEDPLCADPVTHVATLGLADGRVASCDVSALSAFGAVATGSRTPARALTCVPGAGGYGAADGPTVLVSKQADDLLVRLDPLAGTLRWSATVPSVSATGIWCPDLACGSGTVHAAGEADNRVRLLDLADGALVAVRAFDVGAGRVDAPDALLDRTANQGAAWYQTSGAPPTLAFLTTSPPGVVEWPLTAQRGSGLYPHFRNWPDVVAVVPWSDRLGYAAVGAQQLATSAWDAALAGSTVLAVDDGAYFHVGTNAGLETVSWADGGTSGVALPSADWMSLQRLGDRSLLGAVWHSGHWWAEAWTQDQAVAGAPSAARWQCPGGGMVIAAVRLDGQDWAFYWDASMDLHAVALTDALVPIRDRLVGDSFYSVLAVSPNGLTFVSWEFQPFSRDTSVVVWGGDGAGGFSRRATLPVAGQVTGAAFDATGEALYVVTRGPDRIVVVE